MEASSQLCMQIAALRPHFHEFLKRIFCANWNTRYNCSKDMSWDELSSLLFPPQVIHLARIKFPPNNLQVLIWIFTYLKSTFFKMEMRKGNLVTILKKKSSNFSAYLLSVLITQLFPQSRVRNWWKWKIQSAACYLRYISNLRFGCYGI